MSPGYYFNVSICDQVSNRAGLNIPISLERFEVCYLIVIISKLFFLIFPETSIFYYANLSGFSVIAIVPTLSLSVPLISGFQRFKFHQSLTVFLCMHHDLSSTYRDL